jgi:hypothetical protein
MPIFDFTLQRRTTMLRKLLLTSMFLMAATSASAFADRGYVSAHFAEPGFSVSIGSGGYYGPRWPATVYAPRPVYVEPAYGYRPYARVYRPYYPAYGWRDDGWRREQWRRHEWREHHRRDRDDWDDRR